MAKPRRARRMVNSNRKQAKILKMAGKNGQTRLPESDGERERRLQLAIEGPFFRPAYDRLSPLIAPPSRRRQMTNDQQPSSHEEKPTIDLGGELNDCRDPLGLLRRVRRRVTAGATLKATFINARHLSTVGALLAGSWQPTPAPLRFYTRREIEKLFYRAGYTLLELRPEDNPDLQQWRQDGNRPEVAAGPLNIKVESAAEAEEFHTRSYRAVAVPAKGIGDRLQGTVDSGQVESAEFGAQSIERKGDGQLTTDHGLTSIVIVTHNQLGYTKMCLDSIRFLTDEPYELIVVDNGSTDGTLEYLRACGDVKLIENTDNRGFPAAANQGILAGRGRQTLLLNNDVIVTTGWLRRMLVALRSDPSIGVVGPCSNAVGSTQQVEIGYGDLTSLDGWAWDYGRRHDGQREEAERVVGFCLLFLRELVDRIGVLDERFGIGNFEDDDFCLRAGQAGYRTVIARDAFIHHFGHRTFAGAGIDLHSLLEHNARLFENKWAGKEVKGDRLQVTASVGNAVPGVPGIFCNLSPKTCSLSCCMIVRDNERTIAAAVRSILPWVGEVIVVDTGSKDRTAEICRQLGCKVFHFPWPDSFAVARNESLKYATGEWIFWFDSDDVIDAENGRKLAELLQQPIDPKILGLTMKVLCPDAGRDGAFNFTAVDHCKVFRNRPDIRFEGRVHEQVMDSINRLHGEVVFTGLSVVHAGADQTPEGRRGKLRRDIKLLHLQRRETPDHPFLHFNFGMTYADAGKHRKAIRSLRRSLELAQPHESHVRKIYSLLVASNLALGQKDEARASCREGLKLFPKDPELLFRHGILLHDEGRLRQAELSYLAALANDDQPHFSSFDHGIVGHKARHNLASVYKDMGALHKAEEQWRIIIDQVPLYREGWTWLVEILLMQGKLREAQEVPLRLLNQVPALAGTAVTLAARSVEAVGDLAGARRILESGVRECPNDAVPLEALSHLLFFHAHPLEAEVAMAELVRRQPEDAGAQHNLGTVLLRLGRPTEAVEAFLASLRERPDAALTHLSLGYALHNAGRDGEARQAFEKCLRLAPGEPAAAEAARQLHTLAV